MLTPVPLLMPLETQLEEATRRIKARYAQSQSAKSGLKKPRYNTPLYWKLVDQGCITPEEVEADRCRKEIRALRTGRKKTAGTWSGLSTQFVKAPPPPRWVNESPIPSNQYAPNMATTAARDNRLTPQAKALLQIVHARCAETGHTDVTIATLANVMTRCTRSIDRYLRDLVEWGYISKELRKNRRGMKIGLRVRIREIVKPFYEDLKATACMLASKFSPEEMPFPIKDPAETREILDTTQLSYKKDSSLDIWAKAIKTALGGSLLSLDNKDNADIGLKRPMNLMEFSL